MRCRDFNYSKLYVLYLFFFCFNFCVKSDAHGDRVIEVPTTIGPRGSRRALLQTERDVYCCCCLCVAGYCICCRCPGEYTTRGTRRETIGRSLSHRGSHDLTTLFPKTGARTRLPQAIIDLIPPRDPTNLDSSLGPSTVT